MFDRDKDMTALRTDMRLSDYIERRQKDLVFKTIAEELTSRSASNLSEQCEQMTKSVMKTAQEAPKPNTNESKLMNERNPNFITKDIVHFEEGKAPKFDLGKPNMALLPIRPLKEVAEVLTLGAEKYGANSWREGEPINWSRHYAGIQRHLMQFWSGEDFDDETGKNHLAHAAAGILFFLELYHSAKEKDDRCQKSVKYNEP